MFEIKMKALKPGLFASIMIAFLCGNAQNQSAVGFIPGYNKGDRHVYQMVQTQFKQNPNGHYLYIMYDTTYMIFQVTDKNDSQTLIDFKFADAMINGMPYYAPSPRPDYLHTATYKLVLGPKGEFLELGNWEMFASILIEKFKQDYFSNRIDSNTLKYYYLYYHSQANVENAVLARVLDLIGIQGEEYVLETNYSLAREMVNPFGRDNLFKSCSFKPYKDFKYPNSVFFAGKIKTSFEDNECLQEDYYAYRNMKKPDDQSEETAPYILMEDTYTYQWGLISKRIISYTFTHTVFVGSEKQGLDRVINFYSN